MQSPMLLHQNPHGADWQEALGMTRSGSGQSHTNAAKRMGVHISSG